MSVDDLVGSRRQPRERVLDREVAMRLAATEYERVSLLLERLLPEHWALPTDCPGWDVRAMAGHILGMAEMVAGLPEMLRQQTLAGRAAKRSGAPLIDELTALQVAKNAHLSNAELIGRMRVIGPRAAKFRNRFLGLVQNRRMPEAQAMDGVEEWWTFGYLFDVVLTRDPFMHRVDICRATGLDLHVTADHEGVLVDDVARDWAGRHGEPVMLELTGPAVGTWTFGGGERVSMDAVEFCRTVSGREPASGVLAQQVPF
ncbi:MAG TPA: maleylpyruvate isomerase family mycothiol-dependent enzyme [Nocardioidaceae bacterium]|nr:maleylpyruvate isomerase family mycothiol-dependent enzyme [Nocardioidaceae bacterium]